jgi:hypothetical protein
MPALSLRHRALIRLACGLLVCFLPAACSGPPPVINQNEADNLVKIQTAYNLATKELGRPPANLDELLPRLKQFGDPDTLLRSPRDGQPYVINWKVDIHNIQSLPPPVVAYEQKGAGGKHYVLTVMGIMPTSDEEFAKLVPAK